MESFWSRFVELFQCLECPSLDRVTRLVSSTPDVVSLVLCTVVQQFVRFCVSQFCRCVIFHNADNQIGEHQYFDYSLVGSNNCVYVALR